jgi:hypothetical protein
VHVTDATYCDLPTELTARQRALLTYWRGLIPSDANIPPRHAFDPVHVPKLLSQIVLADVLSPDGDVRFRVVGTDMVRAWGSDFTGKRLSELMGGDYGSFVQLSFASCIERRGPILSRSRFRFDTGRGTDTIRLMLPLAAANDPNSVAHVMVAQAFHQSRSGPEKPVIAHMTDDDTAVDITRSVLGRR